MVVIGLTGRRGCGKDTAARFMQEDYGFEVLDFTRDVLAPILVNQGRPATRENLIDIAMAGRRRSHNGVWAEKLSVLIKRRTGKDFVISGIRFAEEVNVFRERFKDGFRLVAIVCEDRPRHERVVRRGTKGEAGITFDEFMETEGKETEMAINGTMRLADFVIDNNGSLKALREEVARLVKVLKR